MGSGVVGGEEEEIIGIVVLVEVEGDTEICCQLMRDR